MLDVRDLRMVRAIAEHGSLVRAARVLGIGQPALTRGLAGIEARLCGPLFERNRRGVRPTDICRVVLAQSDGILERIDSLNAQVVAVRGAQRQTLTIAAGAWSAETIGVVAGARMLVAYPTVQVVLRAAHWSVIPGLVREREASLGVLDLTELGEAPDLVVEPLRPQPGLIVVRPGHPLAGAAAPTLAEILAWPMVFIGRVTRQPQDPMALARLAAVQAGGAHPAFPALVVDNQAMALAAVQASDAVAPVTAVAAAAALRAGEVVALRWHAPWVQARWGIIRRRGHRPSEAEDAYLDLLRSADIEAEARGRGALAAAGIGLAEA